MGSEPWLLGSSDQITLIRRLERDFPTLEEASCNVKIGVATGANKAFIGNFENLNSQRNFLRNGIEQLIEFIPDFLAKKNF